MKHGAFSRYQLHEVYELFKLIIGSGFENAQTNDAMASLTVAKSFRCSLGAETANVSGMSRVLVVDSRRM